jgi:hypothetical protein
MNSIAVSYNLSFTCLFDGSAIHSAFPGPLFFSHSGDLDASVDFLISLGGMAHY